MAVGVERCGGATGFRVPCGARGPRDTDCRKIGAFPADRSTFHGPQDQALRQADPVEDFRRVNRAAVMAHFHRAVTPEGHEVQCVVAHPAAEQVGQGLQCCRTVDDAKGLVERRELGPERRTKLILSSPAAHRQERVERGFVLEVQLGEVLPVVEREVIRPMVHMQAAGMIHLYAKVVEDAADDLNLAGAVLAAQRGAHQLKGVRAADAAIGNDLPGGAGLMVVVFDGARDASRIEESCDLGFVNTVSFDLDPVGPGGAEFVGRACCHEWVSLAGVPCSTYL